MPLQEAEAFSFEKALPVLTDSVFCALIFLRLCADADKEQRSQDHGNGDGSGADLPGAERFNQGSDGRRPTRVPALLVSVKSAMAGTACRGSFTVRGIRVHRQAETLPSKKGYTITNGRIHPGPGSRNAAATAKT